jgi:hypothetical protein
VDTADPDVAVGAETDGEDEEDEAEDDEAEDDEAEGDGEDEARPLAAAPEPAALVAVVVWCVGAGRATAIAAAAATLTAPAPAVAAASLAFPLRRACRAVASAASSDWCSVVMISLRFIAEIAPTTLSLAAPVQGHVPAGSVVPQSHTNGRGGQRKRRSNT